MRDFYRGAVVCCLMYLLRPFKIIESGLVGTYWKNVQVIPLSYKVNQAWCTNSSTYPLVVLLLSGAYAYGLHLARAYREDTTYRGAAHSSPSPHVVWLLVASGSSMEDYLASHQRIYAGCGIKPWEHAPSVCRYNSLKVLRRRRLRLITRKQTFHKSIIISDSLP